MPAAYPTDADLTALLATAGIDPGSANLAGAAAAGREQFEHLTNRVFLAAPGTRVYDYPRDDSGVLPLDRDLLSLTSLSLSDTARTLNTDFWLLPEDGGEDGNPFQALQFPARRGYAGGWNAERWDWGLAGVTPRRAVSLTGVWGYASVIPEDAWLAMLHLGGLWLLNANLFSTFGGLGSWKEADVSEEYATGQKQFLSEWKAQATGALEYYRRRNWLLF